jgi:acetylornithine/N-succinyldiaminopimelate aminotransferase
LLTAAAGDNSVRLLPPLIIGEAETAEAVARLGAACGKLSTALASQARGAAE